MRCNAMPKTNKKISPELQSHFARIKLLLCDVDGILTDATIWIGPGLEMKRFCLPDGMGIRMLKQTDIKIGWISGRPSPATVERARELEVDFLHQSRNSKVIAAEEYMNQNNLSWDQVCFMGDDIVDLGMMKRAGIAVTVPNAIAEVKKMARYITENHGGHGAVREIIDLLLRSQNYWDSLIQNYLE